MSGAHTFPLLIVGWHVVLVVADILVAAAVLEVSHANRCDRRCFTAVRVLVTGRYDEWEDFTYEEPLLSPNAESLSVSCAPSHQLRHNENSLVSNSQHQDQAGRCRRPLQRRLDD